MFLKFLSIKSIIPFLFFFLFWFTTAGATDSKQCDSIIKTGVELMLKKNHVKSLELLSNARDLAEKNKWYKQLFLAQNNIGNNYYMLLDYGEALKQYLISYQIAVKHLDPQHEMIVLNNIAILYGKEKKFEKANEHFYKAYLIARKYNDSLKMGLYSMNLGSLANDENKLQKARNYLNDALGYTKNPTVAIPTQIGICANDLLLGETQRARVRAISLLPKLKAEEDIDHRINLSTIIAKSYLKENNLSSALQWTNNALSEQPDLENKIELYRNLSDIYFRLKSYDLAFQYKDSINISDNELNKIKNGKLYESSEVKFQIQNYKEKIVENEAKIQSERNIFYSVILVIALGIIILILIFRNQLIKNKQKELIIKRDQELIEFKLQKEMADNALLHEKERTTLLEQERLQNEIELRNQKILSRALYQSEKNQLLQDILKSLSEVPQLSENSTIIKDIKALKDYLKTDDDWDNYVRHFDDVNQGFIKRLTEKHPQLTTTDIRYISYVYMNLDTKEIANMLHITPVACRKRKERIEKRLELPEHLSLNAYLLSI
ncbi:tetratricopeptide repeat protein [Flavobacterium terrisoli]|uniref:tetratricopeptide repeat protein n=1 Tax=Flavobacterium terrisoli TaxID=3242195 RepID=UPI002543A35C|nr:tetratricopeptide repeat protein [Flavobacterium buctense]